MPSKLEAILNKRFHCTNPDCLTCKHKIRVARNQIERLFSQTLKEWGEEIIGEDEAEAIEWPCFCDREYMYGGQIVNPCPVHRERLEPAKNDNGILRNELRSEQRQRLAQKLSWGTSSDKLLIKVGEKNHKVGQKIKLTQTKEAQKREEER